MSIFVVSRHLRLSFFAAAVVSTPALIVACGDDDDDAPSAGDAGNPEAGGGDAASPEVDAGPWPSVVIAPLTNPCNVAWRTKIDIGAQTFDVVIDTGSSTLAVAGSSCVNCTDAGVATTYTPGPDARNAHEATFAAYGDTSAWTGDIYTDAVHVPGSKPKIPLRFAAITEQKNGFFGPRERDDCPNAGGDGILGLGPSTGLAGGTESLIDQLVLAGMPDVYAVQLCEGSGKLMFGGFDRTLGTAEPVYTPLLKVFMGFDGEFETHYAINVADLKIGEKSLGSPSSYGPGVLDTGATDMLVPSDVYNAVVAEVTASDGYKALLGAQPFFSPPTCYELDKTNAELDAMLPPLKMKIGADAGSDTIELPATGSYIRRYVPATGKPYYCPTIAPLGAVADSSVKLLIGAAALRSYVTIFDRAQQRAGFMAFKRDESCP